MGTNRSRLTSAEQRDLWKRVKEGESAAEIARALGAGWDAVRRVMAATGGIAPRERKRSARALTLEQREQISRGVAGGLSVRAIARDLGRAPSTVSREISRNGGREAYRAAGADTAAWQRARRPKACRLATNGVLQVEVADKLARYWSPQQIAGWLKQEHPSEVQMQVSHETIYRSLFVQARGALRKELAAYLRTQRLIRRARKATRKGQKRGQIVDAVPISERPPEVEDRAIPGHWEGDLICGTNSSQVATTVERHSRYVVLTKVASSHSPVVVKAVARQFRKLPDHLCKSLTWDRGKEMAAHKQFTVDTKMQVYFCDPKSPWQRGSNENTNGLLRQFLPKGTDLSRFSQKQLDAIAELLNTRPRQTLGFKTPAQMLSAAVAKTG